MSEIMVSIPLSRAYQIAGDCRNHAALRRIRMKELASTGLPVPPYLRRWADEAAENARWLEAKCKEVDVE